VTRQLPAELAGKGTFEVLSGSVSMMAMGCGKWRNGHMRYWLHISMHGSKNLSPLERISGIPFEEEYFWVKAWL
jgi:hypothetical protein